MERFSGMVQWFNIKKGYGFVKVLNHDNFVDTNLFCHQSNIVPVNESTFRKLFPGEYISFEISDVDGKLEAKNIKGHDSGPLLIDNSEYNYKIFPKRDLDTYVDTQQDVVDEN